VQSHSARESQKPKLKIKVMKKLIAVTLGIAALAIATAQAEDAKALYEKNCTKCHGADGKGQTKMGQKAGCKDYTDAKVQAELKDDAALKAIKEGVKDKEGKVVMKPAEGVSDDDAKGLVAYMRTFKK
jgi:cytochrome c553